MKKLEESKKKKIAQTRLSSLENLGHNWENQLRNEKKRRRNIGKQSHRRGHFVSLEGAKLSKTKWISHFPSISFLLIQHKSMPKSISSH